MRRLATREVSIIRLAQQQAQSNRCTICQSGFTTKAPFDPVLDHCHTSGAVRGTLCRACNSLLGKVENNQARFGVRELSAFLHGAAKYLQTHKVNITGLIHPTHKTDEEKRIATNKRRQVARATKRTKV
jgi:hypothetical protein